MFRAFREYRRWLNRYLTWRDEVAPFDERLFPFINNAIAPPEDKRRWSYALKNICETAGVSHFHLQSIRKFRQNWLLRLTGNTVLSATMGAHAKQTLILEYEEPHHQSASARISQFHKKNDPSLSAGPGLCVNSDLLPPTPEQGIHLAAPIPDCVSPEGCLFCIYHRDILEIDYAWKLASHAHLKRLERDDYERPIKSKTKPHPADVVIDRIEGKLLALADRNKDCAAWVKEARSRIWEGRYHPAWEGFIELWELLK
ncbi:hypothetical protein [Halomonas sp. BC04]|uniref:hypothetical protein n=1 Tax=Halomonas sp. BC04 TaxID=1403540 RepID=UPI0012DCE5AC|nr:hypothetical protein [Halomonas sp. BC04]